MTRRSLAGSIAVALVAILSFVALQSPRAEAEGAPAPPTKVGVVNIGKLFVNWVKVKDENAALEKLREAESADFKRQVTALQAALEALEKQGWDKKAEAYREKRRDLAEREDQIKVQVGIAQQTHQERHHKVVERLYTTIVNKVGDYAKANGFAIVFKIQDVPEETPTDEAFERKINRTNILFRDASIDITDEVLKLLNGK